MGKKRHEEEYIERLEKQIRELKSVNRQLLRRIKKLDRKYKPDDLDEEPVKKVTVSHECPKCKLSNLREIVLGMRKYKVCNGCNYRTKVEKV